MLVLTAVLELAAWAISPFAAILAAAHMRISDLLALVWKVDSLDPLQVHSEEQSSDHVSLKSIFCS